MNCRLEAGGLGLGRPGLPQLPGDAEAVGSGYLRVLDESGEDYLYPRDYFVPIELSESLKDALRLAG